MPLYINTENKDEVLLNCECRSEGLHLFRAREMDDWVFVGPYFVTGSGFWCRLRTAWYYLWGGWNRIEELCLDRKTCESLSAWLRGS